MIKQGADTTWAEMVKALALVIFLKLSLVAAGSAVQDQEPSEDRTRCFVSS
jgi:hypothetical protein